MCVCVYQTYIPLLYFMDLMKSTHETIVMIMTITVIAPSAAEMLTKGGSKAAPPTARQKTRIHSYIRLVTTATRYNNFTSNNG